jgi:hypothetical protein
VGSSSSVAADRIDPDVLESLIHDLLLPLLRSPVCCSQDGVVQKLVGVTCNVLQFVLGGNTSSGAVTAALDAVGVVFSLPSTTTDVVGTGYSLLDIGCSTGGAALIHLLLKNLTGSSHGSADSLHTTTTVTTHAVINCLYEVLLGAHLRHTQSQTGASPADWLHICTSMSNNNHSDILTPFSTNEERGSILQLILKLVVTQDKRKFKALLTDISKICNGLEMKESIHSHFDF